MISDRAGCALAAARQLRSCAARRRVRLRPLEEAGPVALIGVCDENCSDVDLIVRDPSGREVGRDFEDDDIPF